MAIAALFGLGYDTPADQSADRTVCKPRCEAANRGGLDRESRPASWPSATRKPLTRPRPAPKPTADPGKSWTAVGSPSPASRRFDQRKILRTRGNPVGPARGLRVGRQDRRSREQQRDRKPKRDFAHRSSLDLWVSRLFSSDAISFDLAAARAKRATHTPRHMDNWTLCVINYAYGLETVTTVPPDTPVNVIQPRAPTVPPVGAHSPGMTVAQCPGCHQDHPGKWGGRQVPASPDYRDRGWNRRLLGRQQKAFARRELFSA